MFNSTHLPKHIQNGPQKGPFCFLHKPKIAGLVEHVILKTLAVSHNEHAIPVLALIPERMGVSVKLDVQKNSGNIHVSFRCKS